MFKKLFSLVLFTLILQSQLSFATENAKNYPINKILEVSVDASINPATLSYLQSSYEKAKKESFDLILLKMDTPGGLVSTTKEILTLMGGAEIPVVVWITPAGASATSAGAIITAGAHLSFMSPGTNIGAATPITMNEQEKQSSDMKLKSINDLVALVESLALSRGKNPQLTSKMITEAASYDAPAALKNNLVDGLVSNQKELLAQINNKVIEIKGKQLLLQVAAGVVVQEKTMDVGQYILNIFANPSFAYLLFIFGGALLYLEMQAPGGFVAGGMGLILIILAGISFQVLPINFGSLALICLAFVLFILEAYISSYGMLTLAGIVALTFGSLFLYRTDKTLMEFNSSVVYATVLAISTFVSLIAAYWIYDSKRENISSEQLEHDPQSIIGKTAIIVSEDTAESDAQHFCYQIKLAGEFWKAYAPTACQVGDKVTVTGRDAHQLHLKIAKLS